MIFGDLIDDFERAYIPRLSTPTRCKYASLLRKHVRPDLARLTIKAMSVKELDAWLAGKAANGLSWGTRVALRNLVSSIFTRAERWGTYEGRKPTRFVDCGRRRAVYEKRKLTVEQTKKLLQELRPDVRMVCMIALFCGLRISEVLGLCWKHVDFDRQMLLIRQRYWRGDLDETKTEAGNRDIPYGSLHSLLKSLYPGERAKERYCFEIRTQSPRGITRDDHSIRRYFLQPAAKKLGIYYLGFGFHAFRREAITAIAEDAGAIQACRVAGHTRMDHTLLYGLKDRIAQERAIRRIQEPYVNAGLLKVAS